VVLLLAGLVVALGALVQGAVGFGMALVATPLLAIIDPALVPVPLLLVTSAHAVLSLLREPRGVEWRGVRWALLGRLPGTALGVLAVATLPARAFLAVVAVTVLTCAVLSVIAWRPRPTVAALLVAGVVSGAGGTAAAIGGPPVALLYQDRDGPQVRATMAAYFTAGSALSITGLLVGGQIGPDHLLAAAVLLPALALGFLASGPARRYVDRGWVRPAVVGMSAVGAVVLLAQAAFG
jgi:hypothetical protein